VIDTVGFNDKFWFDRRGHPHAGSFTPSSAGRARISHLDNQVTIDDPGACPPVHDDVRPRCSRATS
jgi:hypothetical protein